MVHGQQRVIILNARDSLKDYVASLSKDMGPETVWSTAMAWHLLETLQDCKRMADELVHAGHAERALLWYRAIYRQVSAASDVFESDPEKYQIDLALTIALLFCIIIDAAVTHFFLVMRLGRDPEGYRGFFHLLLTGFTSLPSTITSPIGGDKPALGPMWMSWLLVMDEFVTSRDASGLRENVQHFTEMNDALFDDEYFKYDMDLVLATANDKDVSNINTSHHRHCIKS